MIVNRAVEQVGVAALGQVQELVAGQRDLGPFQQGAEQAEFTAGERQGDAVRPDLFALAGADRIRFGEWMLDTGQRELIGPDGFWRGGKAWVRRSTAVTRAISSRGLK